jgi:hypothetical protein
MMKLEIEIGISKKVDVGSKLEAIRNTVTELIETLDEGWEYDSLYVHEVDPPKIEETS